MSDEKKKPKPSRFTLAPLYLAAGLVSCYLVLTKMIPKLAEVAAGGDPRGRAEPRSDWQDLVRQLSDWVIANSSACITAGVIVMIVGLVLPFLFRPTKYVVWIAALALFAFDLVLFWESIHGMLGGLLKEAGDLGGR